MPTVTATAKPAVSPIADKLHGRKLGSDFAPELAEDGADLTTDRFRKLLATAGYQVFGAAESGTPTAGNARGWTEYGEFDKLGHNLQSKLPARVEEQLDLLLDRIQVLLEAGWKRVRVVTDHGWMLVPGGMPKVDLPRYLAESRWSRCASIKDSSRVDLPVSGWSWNVQERFACTPGAHCFFAEKEYAHGGLSLQECVIPVLTFVSKRAAAGTTVSITDLRWTGLRCRATLQGAAGFLADLRTKPNIATSTITEPKTVDADGKVALLVADDALEGTVVSLVIVDASGRVICRQNTTVGGDE